VLRRASLRTKLDVAFTSNDASGRVRKFPKLSRDEILNDKDEPASTTVEEIETNDAEAETKPGRTMRLKGELIIGKDSYLMKTEKVPDAVIAGINEYKFPDKWLTMDCAPVVKSEATLELPGLEFP
jgi:hypothetical protein